MADEGVNHNLMQLCELHLGGRQEPTVVQQKLSRTQQKRILWKKSWNTLFTAMNGPHRSQHAREKKHHSLPVIEQLYALGYDLRMRRKFDAANGLENSLDKLRKDGITDSLRSILELILSLADIQKKDPVPIVGDGPFNLPILFPSQKVVLPYGPLCHGDSRIQRKDHRYYTHYPSRTFELSGVSINYLGDSKYDIANATRCEEEPGDMLLGNGVFNIKNNPENKYAKWLQYSLFGALSQSQALTMDVILDLPDIKKTYNTRIFELKPTKIPKISMDEGFYESFTSPESSPTQNSLTLEETDERSIWELALEHKPSRHYTWERRGLPPTVVEKPYLTDAGVEAFNRMYMIYINRLRLVDPAFRPSPPVCLAMSTIVNNTLDMLIGVPSRTFQLDQEIFSVTPGTYVSGMSPEAVTTGLKDLADCGTQYVQLARFSSPPCMDSHYHAGLVFNSFTVAIRKYLQHYRGQILSISRTKTLLELSVLLHKARGQMSLLSSLCHCDKQSPAVENQDSDFPTGVKLLSYLYEKTFEASYSQHYAMLLSLFHASCGPYITFIQEWAFQGNCYDIYGEFLIQTNEEYLRFRDRHYWTHGYVLVSGNLKDSIPSFLQNIANDIFVCGKSINLLRLIAPKHHLLAAERETPRISIKFSEEEIYSIEQQCRIYKTNMIEVIRQYSKSRQEVIRMEEQAKQVLFEKARKRAMQHISRVHERAEAVKKAADLKKRAAFAELKDQMEKDMKRRTEVKEHEKEEDAARVATLNRQELLEAAVDEEVVKKAREEMVKEYEKMTTAVALREQHALWRVARHRLETRRMNFLVEDEEKWQAELAAQPFATEANDVFEDSGILLGNTDQQTKKDDVEQTYSASTTIDISDGQMFVTGDGLTSQDMFDHADSNDSNELTTIVQDHLSATSVPQIIEQPNTPDDIANQNEIVFDNIAANYDLADNADIPVVLSEYKVDEMSEKSIQENKNSPLVADRHLPITTALEPTSMIKASNELKVVTSEISPIPCVKIVSERHASIDSQESPLFSIVNKSNLHVTMQSVQEIDPIMKLKRSKNQNELKVVTNEMTFWGSEISPIPCVKTVSERHASIDSQESPLFSIFNKSNLHVTMQSVQEIDPIMKLKRSKNQNVNQQSEQPLMKSHIKIFKDRHHSLQSEPMNDKTNINMVSEWQVSTRSEPANRRNMLKSQLSQLLATPSRYGLIIPTMKPYHKASPSTNFEQYLIIPRHKGSKDTTDLCGIGMNQSRYATKQSEFIDYNKINMEKFKALNVHGHASDSTIQRLLYGANYDERRRLSLDSTLQEVRQEYDAQPWTDIVLDEYNTVFNMLNDLPTIDLLTNRKADAGFTRLEAYEMSNSSDISGYRYISLAAIMTRSVKAPLAVQSQLVNESLVNFFNEDLEINKHFTALRRFLLLQDGEFGQVLSDQLFEQLAQNALPHNMLNPMYLNNILSRALQSSLHGDTQYAGLLSFALKYIPSILNHHGPNALDCLDLAYRVEWPINVIITNNALSKYSKVFSFMLELKRAVWVLKDIWHRLKRDAIINKVSKSPQSTRLHLFRHEMQHFVKVMQECIANQVIHVTWQELQEDLTDNVHSLDDLHHCHSNYINKCVSRCLLSKEAVPIMKIIKEIFKTILKFRKQLISHSWQTNENGDIVHPAFDSLCNAFKVFQNCAKFLFKVVTKLAMRGYEPHLQELLLRLDFNVYYSRQ